MTDSGLDLDSALAQALSAAQIGREILLDYFGHLTQVEEKEQAGLVSEADLKSEEAIIKCLLEKFPQHQIMGEEQSFKSSHQGPVLENNKTPIWIIDPLDGTTNYVHGFHVFCISIGLQVNGELVVGVIDVPKLEQTFYAVKGKGAFVKEQEGQRKLSVSRRTQLKDSLLATGFIGMSNQAFEEQLKAFSALLKMTRGVRRPGAAAYDLCQVADGVYDGFWERNLNPWDTAAGALLVKEAGGLVTNYWGESFAVEMDSILAVNPHIQQPMIQVLGDCHQRQ
ncbi:MAG: inositol monophosphatase [Bdellovibrionaceae bacterium]|nr:inositol monophosphatase [Bdellovibrionales bacterium]MCB9086515.1 inositol monophosphatase [Pseudobdellovibrionaceae bacterium]